MYWNAILKFLLSDKSQLTDNCSSSPESAVQATSMVPSVKETTIRKELMQTLSGFASFM